MTHCAGAKGYETLVTDIWPWVDASVYSFIPLVVIVTLNSLIIRHVVCARRLRRRLASFAMAPVSDDQQWWAAGTGRLTPAAACTAAPAAYRGGRQRRALSSIGSGSAKGEHAQTRMIALLLAVSFTFLAATLPRCVTLIATDFINAASADDPTRYRQQIFGSVRLALAATDLLMYANHAINFFLYCATGEKFRRQLTAVVCFALRRQPRRVPSSRFDARGPVTGSVAPPRRRRAIRRENFLCDDSASAVDKQSVV